MISMLGSKILTRKNARYVGVYLLQRLRTLGFVWPLPRTITVEFKRNTRGGLGGSSVTQGEDPDIKHADIEHPARGLGRPRP